GVDTGELKTSEEGSAERKLAVAARNFVRWHLERTEAMHVSHLDLGKYGGRFPAVIWLNISGEMVNINQELIANGLAVPYFGGTKVVKNQPDIWERLYEVNQELVDQLLELY
ncbi:MAG: thermonuclease family protein, partial [Bdellovibrionales bacterium]|nr:thermonuclease family protein [Bdellovibrionales bacterium]